MMCKTLSCNHKDGALWMSWALSLKLVQSVSSWCEDLGLMLKHGWVFSMSLILTGAGRFLGSEVPTNSGSWSLPLHACCLSVGSVSLSPSICHGEMGRGCCWPPLRRTVCSQGCCRKQNTKTSLQAGSPQVPPQRVWVCTHVYFCFSLCCERPSVVIDLK